jgi:hypothetical protein
MERGKRDDNNAKDDNNHILNNENEESNYLKVAYILLYFLMSSEQAPNKQIELNESKETVFIIFDIFDHGVIYLIDDFHIDRPTNTLILIFNFY